MGIQLYPVCGHELPPGAETDRTVRAHNDHAPHPDTHQTKFTGTIAGAATKMAGGAGMVPVILEM